MGRAMLQDLEDEELFDLYGDMRELAHIAVQIEELFVFEILQHRPAH